MTVYPSQPSGNSAGAEASAMDLATLEAANGTSLRRGDIWYVVEEKWMAAYKEHLGNSESPHPGPIDNSPLLDANGNLRANLTEGVDFVYVPRSVWDSLVATVGLRAGQTSLPCSVVEQGLYSKSLVIELRPPSVKVALASAPEKTQTIKISRGSKLTDLRDTILMLFDLVPQESRLYQRLPDLPPDAPYELLRTLNQTLYDLSLTDDRLFLLDVKAPDWTIPLRDQQQSPAGSSGMSTRSQTPLSVRVVPLASGGLCGLSNLGNTCFMNSGLQCMSNCPPLTEYFRQDRHLDEINEKNPLGTGGEMARAYANLIQEMWSGRNSVFIPRQMKQTIGRFKETFLGYQQQDSQELIAFLLDGLHEDLNRVRAKPYVVPLEDDNRPEHMMADDSWRNYRRRNDSIIVDLFHGQIKSTVVCPECAKVSVTFDPSCYLSVPLPPTKKERLVPVTVLYRSPSRAPTQFKVAAAKTGTIEELLETLSKICGVNAERMVAYDVYGSKIFKIFESTDLVSQIKDSDIIYVGELEHPRGKDFRSVQLSQLTTTASTCFGIPLVLSVPKRDISYDELLAMITSAMQPWLEQPGENWWKGFDGEEIQPPPVFNVVQLNSHGSQVLKILTKDDFPAASVDIGHLAIQWHMLAKKFYRTLGVVADPSVSAFKEKPKGCGLHDCFELYTTTEQLGQDDAWYCPRCRKHQRASKTLQLWRLPKVLIVQLKRFQYTRYARDKIESLVDFPITGLDVTKFIASGDKGQHVYDLVAVSNHMGGLGGGHYTAYAKNAIDGRWYEFDDSRVTIMADEKSVMTKYGYILFYLRREDHQNGTTDVEMKDAT